MEPDGEVGVGEGGVGLGVGVLRQHRQRQLQVPDGARLVVQGQYSEPASLRFLVCYLRIFA